LRQTGACDKVPYS